MSCVSVEDTEFRSYLETRSPEGESIVEHMARTGITLEHERHAFETIKNLQNRASTKPLRTRPPVALRQNQRHHD